MIRSQTELFWGKHLPGTHLERFRRLLRILVPPGAGVGLLFALGLFAWALLTREDFAAFGVRDARIEKIVFGPFLGHVLWTQAQILLGYLAVGWVLGALGGAAVAAWSKALGRSPGRWSRRGLALAVVVVLHLLLLARSIAEYPQLYTESFLDRGGFRADLQIALTEWPLWAYDLVLALLAALFLLGVVLALWRMDAAARAWRRWRALSLRWRKSLASGAVLAAVLALFFALWPGGAAQDGPNLLLIGVDSLRPDRLSCYGHRRETPNIDRLAREGVLFERAFVSLPRTFPSWTTILTGQWPNRHGIRHMFPTQEERERIPPALPRALARQGYQTSVVADYAGDIFTRVDYGFERVDAPYFNFPVLIALRSFEVHKQLLPYVTNSVGRRIYPVLRELAQNADARDLGDRVVAELKRLAPRGKFLLTAFFSATHFPYAAPSPYYRLYTDPAYTGTSRYHRLPTLGKGSQVTEADLRQLHDLYDGAVKSVDDQIGRILETLDRLGSANTFVVLLADHGEHLYESGMGMGHGDHLRGDRALRIPLIVRGPGVAAGKRVPGIVRDVDLAPTLSARLGVALAAPTDGADLSPLLAGERDDLGLEHYAETGLWFAEDGDEFFQRQRIPYPGVTQFGRLDEKREIVLQERYRELALVAKHRMVQTQTHKLIYLPTRQGVHYELYDLRNDPEQLRDVSAEQPEVVGALKEKLFRWMLSEPGVQLRREFLIPTPRAAGSPPVAQEGSRDAGG
jgi:arylsulfatase A-like enzyme